MANFTVTNLNDSGAGSLRQAIADANDVLQRIRIFLMSITTLQRGF